MVIYRITNIEQLIDLWKGVYNKEKGIDWSELLLYYDDEIVFKDSIQEIIGINDFSAMTERLGRRSRDLKYIIHNASMNENLIFVEWEMQISYKKVSYFFCL